MSKFINSSGTSAFSSEKKKWEDQETYRMLEYLNNSDIAIHGFWYRVRSQEVDAIITTLVMIMSTEELDGKG